MRRPPQDYDHARVTRRPGRTWSPTAASRPSPTALRRAAPRPSRCGHGCPFTLAFLVRLIGTGDLLV